LHVYIVHNIKFNIWNGYSWTRKIHKIKTMGIIVIGKKTISRLLGRPKNLFTLKVWYAICEGWFRRVICHCCDKSSKIIQPPAPPQQQFIPIWTIIKWTTLQVLSIQCRLFESTNVAVRYCCVQTNVMFSQLLQLDVMHNFNQIANGHVSPHFIIKFLQKKGKEKSTKFTMS
jgi:hypothetical protein